MLQAKTRFQDLYGTGFDEHRAAVLSGGSTKCPLYLDIVATPIISAGPLDAVFGSRRSQDAHPLVVTGQHEPLALATVGIIVDIEPDTIASDHDVSDHFASISNGATIEEAGLFDESGAVDDPNDILDFPGTGRREQ